MVEVLVTIVILALGLLGLAGLQSRMQISEVESYQRAQALILLNDMVNRFSANRINAANYVTSSPLGTGMTCPTTQSTRQQIDAAEWCNALQGVGEKVGVSNAGTMIGGRGCVEELATGEYLISVAWQGLTPISDTSLANQTCGQGSYDTAGTRCVDDLCRRVVSTVVLVAPL